VKPLSKVALASLALATACGSAQKAPRSRMSPKEIVTVAKPAIVRIEVGADRVGTGFVIDKAGLVVTNLHVVVPPDDIQVKMLDGKKYPVQRVVGWDDLHDLVILDIDPPHELPVLRLGDSDSVSPGDPVLAIGNPLGVLDYTVSDGLLSAVRLITPELSLFQITAPISQGSSGGPVFNSYGEVIGVVTAFLAGGQSLNFAIPAKYLVALSSTRKQAQTVAEFKAETAKLVGEPQPPKDTDNTPIVRSIPVHEVKLLDGCSKEALIEAADAISRAIQLGAPLYNDGNFDACFMVYEGVSIKFAGSSACPGVRTALADGLERAKTLPSAKAKAWALRDAFDGLIDVKNDGVILRKLRTMP
jgi:hypothetical protein